MPPEKTAHLEISTAGSLAVVIDASESAWQYEETILQAATQVLDRAPSYLDKRLFFLGNAEPYPAGLLPGNAGRWWQENRKRASLIGPLADAFDRSKVILVGAGPVYDIEDYKDSHLSGNLLLVSAEYQTLQGNTGVGREYSHHQLNELLYELYDPLLGVTISGDDFMPYFWDNQEYVLNDEGGISLTASPVKDPSIALAFWGNDVSAMLLRHSGKESVPLQLCGIDTGNDWKQLTEAEAEAFINTMQGKPFPCPVCSGIHEPGELRCYAHGSLLGELVYPSLEGRRGMIVLKSDGGAVKYRFHPVSSMKIGYGRAAVWRNGTVLVYRYDSSGCGWRGMEKLPQYYSLEDGGRLLYL